MGIYFLELKGYDKSTAKVVDLYFSTHGYTTAPVDVPSNQFYNPRISKPGNFERAMFSSGATTGAGQSAFGNIELVNIDDELSYLLDFAFDGRALKLFYLDDGQPFATRKSIFSGTIDQVEVSEQRVTIRLRSRLEELTKTLQTEKFLGTTTAGGQNTAEGGPNDFKDRPKPLAFGINREVPLLLVNSFDRLFMGALNEVFSVEGVYENGLAYSRVGNVQTSIAGLMSVTLAAGQYALMLKPFIIRVGAKPTGVITCDFTEGASPVERTASAIIKRILLLAGKVEGIDFLASDVTAFSWDAPAEQGVWIGPQDVQISAPIQSLLNGVQGYLTEDRLGRFRMGQFRDPASTASMTFGAQEILNDGQAISVIATSDPGKGIPTAKVTGSYAPFYQTFDDGSIAGAVSDERRAMLKLATRQVVEEAPEVRTVHLQATEVEIATLIAKEADARKEIKRQLDLRKVQRTFLEFKLPSTLAADVDLRHTIEIKLLRLGLRNGRKFVVVRIVEQLPEVDVDSIGTTRLQVWG